MDTKSFDTVGLKAVGDDGEFEAIVSVFGNVDSYGDVVVAGAFASTLDEWADSGDRIPVILSHRWNDPDAHIGEVVEAKELMPGDARLPTHLVENGGLWVRGKLDGDAPAQKVRRLLKGGRIKQFSFAYDVRNSVAGEVDGVSVHELRELKLHEVGPTFLGANRETALLSAKSDGVSDDALIDTIKALIADAGRVDDPAVAVEPATHPAKAHPVDPRRELDADSITLISL